MRICDVSMKGNLPMSIKITPTHNTFDPAFPILGLYPTRMSEK